MRTLVSIWLWLALAVVQTRGEAGPVYVRPTDIPPDGGDGSPFQLVVTLRALTVDKLQSLWSQVDASKTGDFLMIHGDGHDLRLFGTMPKVTVVIELIKKHDPHAFDPPNTLTVSQIITQPTPKDGDQLVIDLRQTTISDIAKYYEWLTADKKVLVDQNLKDDIVSVGCSGPLARQQAIGYIKGSLDQLGIAIVEIDDQRVKLVRFFKGLKLPR